MPCMHATTTTFSPQAAAPLYMYVCMYVCMEEMLIVKKKWVKKLIKILCFFVDKIFLSKNHRPQP